MYDLSSQFNTFYDTKVRLSLTEKNILREKKNLNIDRLKSGLDEYNIDNSTSYKIVETKEQGSVAMSTVTQNDSKEYDIDVAIIFDAESIEGNGSIAIKNVVVDALKRKCTQLKNEPAALTNCVRIEYSDGYHIDFAIYKRIQQEDDSYLYNHAGSSWRERDPAAINNWFNDEVHAKGKILRQIIMLSKMFCKSRDSWQMPGGLIQTVLCDEKLQEYDRLDESFYYTMVEVNNRLASTIEVYNPTDTSKSLLLKEKDRTEMTNWGNRLTDKLAKLDILSESCTEKEAKDAWYNFFNHDFWKNSSDSNDVTESYNISSFSDTEEFIESKFNIANYGYYVVIDCTVSADGWRPKKLSELLGLNKWLQHNRKLDFYIAKTNVPDPNSCEIYWKVRNVGPEAEQRNCIRGQIIRTNQQHHREKTNFYGPHYVECYLVKNKKCIARGRIDVPIE